MTRDVSEVLAPCPFCGSQPKVLPTRPDLDGDAWARVICVNSYCHVQPVAEAYVDQNPKAAAIAKWNTRAQPAVLAVPVDDQNLMDEQHLRYCDRNIEASQAKGDADGVSFWHQWKAEYQRRIAAAPAIHADHVPDAGKMIHEGGEHA